LQQVQFIIEDQANTLMFKTL